MEYRYIDFVLYVLGILAIPAAYWLLEIRSTRRIMAELARHREEVLGGPTVKSSA
jgi:hypothetical protein